MLSAWTKHLKDPDAKQAFADYVKGSKSIIDRLQGILDEVETSLERSEISADAFDNPNWAYKQAYMNGCKGMLQKVKTITSINEREQNDQSVQQNR